MSDKFDREKSDAIFTETLEWLDVLNSRDGKFDYSDYVTLHNDFTALYDSFSHVDEIINGLRQQLAEANQRADAAVRDIEELLGQADYLGVCWACKRSDVCVKNDVCNPKWRGVTE